MLFLSFQQDEIFIICLFKVLYEILHIFHDIIKILKPEHFQ
jgi:hypothetical protein